MKCHNNDVIVVMGSINQSKSFLAHGSLPWVFTVGGYHGRSAWEVTAGVYHGRSLQEFTVGGSMI